MELKLLSIWIGRAHLARRNPCVDLLAGLELEPLRSDPQLRLRSGRRLAGYGRTGRPSEFRLVDEMSNED
jgi:hypothetical protein